MKSQKDAWESYLKYQIQRLKQLKTDPKVTEHQVLII